MQMSVALVRWSAPIPPSSSRICTWWCAVCCALSPVRGAGLRCKEGVEPSHCPSCARKDRIPVGPRVVHAFAMTTYSTLAARSLHQIDLPIGALNAYIEFPHVPCDPVGLGSELRHR